MTWDDYDLIGDRGVDGLMQRVEVVPNEEATGVFPEQWLSFVEISTRDGTFAERRAGARGEPEAFLDWDEVESKFDGLAERVLTDNQRRAVKQAARDLSRGDGPRHFCELLRVPSGHHAARRLAAIAAGMDG
jgi:2-methylcitrate dehydratase PrpD